MSRLPFPRDVYHGDGKRHSEALTGPVSGVWLMSGQSWHCPGRDAVGQTSPGHCPAKWELGHRVPPMEGERMAPPEETPRLLSIPPSLPNLSAQLY